MSFLIRNIEIDLNAGSIQKAIDEIEFIESRLQPAMTHLIEEMIEKGVEIARAELIFFPKPAYDYGALSESINCGMQGPGEGVVTTGISYAAYVEFGTGASNENGWTYYDTREGRFRFTFGMEARPFMYNTYKDLEAEIEANGGRIVAEYLA